MARLPNQLEEFETWFTRRGVPHFIVGYSARTDIWTRALPLLVVAYVVGGLNALDVRRSLGWNVAAGAMVMAILAGTWALTNRIHHRPAFSAPDGARAGRARGVPPRPGVAAVGRDPMG